MNNTNQKPSLDQTIDSVQLLDLKTQYQSIKKEIDQAIAEVCESQHFIMGPVVQRFEKQIETYCGCHHAIGVSSGSDALLIALMALEITSGHEVITTPFTFFATGGAIARVGATPVFCDIDADTYNLDPEAVETYIESNCEIKAGKLINIKTGNEVKAIMPVHLFGQATHMEEIMSLAKKFDLKVIEDAAQAIGAKTAEGKTAGTQGDIGCYSFFPSKNLGAFGDGGMVVTNDDELAERLRILRVHGGKPKYYHAFIGGNFRLDALQAAVLEVKLKHLDKWTAARQANAQEYNEQLNGIENIKTPVEIEGAHHIYNQYTIASLDGAPKRDSIREQLTEMKIGTEVYYPVPLHLQECFSYLGYAQGDIPKAEKAANSVFSIPIHPELMAAEIQHVSQTLSRILESSKS